MRLDWRHYQPRLCNHKHMTAPKNAILPSQNWGRCPSPAQKFRQHRHLTSSIFGCFESLIFTKFLASQDRSLFSNFFAHLRSSRCLFPFFSRLHLQKLARRARRLPDVPCPTCPTSARRLPDVCPTSPDVCPTFARRLPDVCLLPK